MSVPKHLRNEIKTGQLWQKNDTGIIVKIISKAKDPYYNTVRVNRNLKNGAHHISRYDLIRHYTKL
jgi:hypothetical protein